MSKGVFERQTGLATMVLDNRTDFRGGSRPAVPGQRRRQVREDHRVAGRVRNRSVALDLERAGRLPLGDPGRDELESDESELPESEELESSELESNESELKESEEPLFGGVGLK